MRAQIFCQLLSNLQNGMTKTREIKAKKSEAFGWSLEKERKYQVRTTRTEDKVQGRSMKCQEVLACSFPAWYPDFAKVTFKSVTVDIPDDVLEYLRSRESLVLPKECSREWGTAGPRPDDDGDEDGGEEEGTSGWSDEEGGGDEEEAPSFPAFAAAVREAIGALGGKVFCKLNWSSPRDAAWIGFGNSLKCSDLSQLLLLLKSSDFVRHDLVAPFEHCSDDAGPAELTYRLVLRRWTEINPGHEYRCFVSRGRLVGVCQRDATSCYGHIRGERDSVVTDVRSFFLEHVDGRFPLESYIFDVVRRGKDVVKLVDFNPFGPPTDAVLFDWEELEAGGGGNEDDGVDFRFVEDDAGIQPNGLRQYSVPVDMLDLATGRDPHKLIDFLKLQTEQQQQRSGPGGEDGGGAD